MHLPIRFLQGLRAALQRRPVTGKLVPDDLPVATANDVGGVSVPDDGGLAVDAGGGVTIDNSVVAGNHAVVSYNSHGLVTGGRDLQPGDLPAPSGGQLGGVKAGDGISISFDGTISQTKTGVTTGTYTKVSVDDMGNVVTGALLEASDIPNIDFNQIDNIVIGEGELADKSVNRRHLANYAISFIQEEMPVIDSTLHVGCLWFQESTATLSMFNSNSWMNIGIGRLSAENLRYCGIFDPTSGEILAITQFGQSAGFSAGDVIPAATDDYTGVYFVATKAGNGTDVLPGVNFDGGDWIVCNGAVAGWSRIDTLSSGGGGGGTVNVLNDLLNCNANPSETGAFLTWDQSVSNWVATTEVDCGSF